MTKPSPRSGVAPPVSGQFKPGQSANPGGRRKDPEGFAKFREYLRTYTQEAAQALVDRALGPVMADGTRDASKGSERMLETLIAYQWGRPPQPMTGEGGEGPAGIRIERVIIDPANPAAPDAEGVSAVPPSEPV